MLEGSRGPYKIDWIIQRRDNIEKYALRSFDLIERCCYREFTRVIKSYRNFPFEFFTVKEIIRKSIEK